MFVWNSSYEVGIDLVDKQHRQLINLINELETSLNGSLKDNSITEVAYAIVEYAIYHFSEEEKLMDACYYPQGSCRKREHEEFVTKLHEVRS